MILKKVESVGNWQYVLELHPRITCIIGLPAERRGRLAAMITAVVRGDLVGLHADIDFEGRIQELTTQLANDLELYSTPPDVLLREQDLPGAIVIKEFGHTAPDQVLGPTDEEIRAEVLAELPDPAFVDAPVSETPTSAPTETPARNQVDPSMLEPHNLTTAVYVSDLRGPLRTAWIAMERARQERDSTLEELNKAENRGDEGEAAPVSIEELRQEATQAQMAVREAERLLGDGADIGAIIEERNKELTNAHQKRDQLKAALHAFESRPAPTVADTQGVQRAFSALLAERDAAAQVTAGPPARALTIIDALNDVEQRLRDHVPKNAPSWLVEQTKQQVEDAHQAVLIAESEYKMAAADSTDVQAVEQAHNEVMAIDESGGKLFGGNRKQAMEAALAKEKAALDRIGLPHYESFRLQLGSLGRDRGVVEEMLNRARASLIDAQAMWEELQSPTDDPDLQGLRNERDRIFAEARLLVGDVDELGLMSALQNFREDTSSVNALEADLWRELALVDVPQVDVDVDVIAEAWLAERSTDVQVGLDREDNRTRMRSDIANADAQINELENELAQLRSRESSISSADDLRAMLDEAEVAYAEAENRLMVAQQESQVRGQSEIELSSLRQTLAAAQTVYEKARGIFLEGLQQVRANDAASFVDSGIVDERGLAQVQYEGEVASIAAERERRIAERIYARDQAIIQSQAGGRWDAPYYMAPTVDIRHCDQEDIEVFVLSRLSALRNIGQAGSVPLVVDDAFKAFGPEAIGAYLELLQRVSRVMQLVYLTEDTRIEEWAASLGPDSASVIHMS